MFTILITDTLHPAGLDILREDPQAELIVTPNFDAELLNDRLASIDAWLVDREMVIDEALLDQMPSLKIIGRAGSRIRHIDIEAATRRGILVLNLPHGMAVSMAEHTLALILAASRQIPQAHADMQSGQFLSDRYDVRDVSGKRLGLIGFNQVAMRLVDLVKPFNMEILVYEPKLSEQIALDFKIELVDLEDLLQSADIVSLHGEVTPTTELIINQEQLGQMKKGVILVNTTSPRLVDAGALLAALKSENVHMAAMDGQFDGADGLGDPFQGSERVIQTPELAIRSVEGRAEASMAIAHNILNALKQKEVLHPVNAIIPPDIPYAKVLAYAELGRKIGLLQAQLGDGRISKVEVEVSGESLQDMVQPIGAGLLQGLLQQGRGVEDETIINDVNAPILAQKRGVQISQVYNLRANEYTNLVSCRVQWYTADGESGSRLVSGVLFDEKEPRIVYVDGYRVEAKPDQYVLVMRNQDVPGVIGQVATLLAAYQVNIAEWRLGRLEKGGEALSFINLDGEPPQPVVDALRQAPAINSVQLVYL